MLTRFYCDNYKCLVNFEFRPKPLMLLMGRNGAGKSTVFEVMELLRDFAARGEPCDGRFVGRTRTRWQDVKRQQFELDVVGPEGKYSYSLLMDEWGTPAHQRVIREAVALEGRLLFLFEENTVHLYNDRFESRVQFAFDHRKSGLAIVEPRPENLKLTWFKKWFRQVFYVQIDPRKMGAKADKESVDPAFDLANFAEWYRHLRLEGAVTEDLRSSLQTLIDGFKSLDLKDAGLNTRVLEVSVSAGADKSSRAWSYTFDELSDGQRALIGLYTLLHFARANSPTTLCIDEPDNYVALPEIQPWLSQISDLEEAGSQVLVASHHPELLNQLATQNGAVLERIDGRQSRVRSFEAAEDCMLSPAEIVARGWEIG